jgi:hypothetical protein
MPHRWLLRTCAAVVALATALVIQGPLGALAAAPGAPPGGSSGHDISWPQCGSSYPGNGSFGIVGVTNGRAWSANPCLASEYQWASAYPRTPDVYMNTANPAPHSSYYWPASGASDPALCRDATVTTDPGCAYDYGWHTAANALATANAALGSSPVGYWWLDVETSNTWNGDASSNAADVQGSIDYLLSQHVAGVGVYSTGYQWTTITGGYSTSTASQYSSAWSAEFTSPNGISNSPSWVAGASGPSDAPSYCSSSFLGTTTWLVQYVSGGFDVDYACGTPVTTAPGAPRNLSASAGNARATLSWSAPSSNGGSSITSYDVYRSTTSGGEGTTPIATTGGSAASYTDTTVANGTTYYYEVAATNTVGTGAMSNQASATPTPVATVPSAPQNLTAKTDASRGVDLAWSAPSSNGGSAITSYQIYRGTRSGQESYYATISCTSTSCAYANTSTRRGTTYYYELVAVNKVGTGPLSNQASAKAG